jgi:branched-chain amino acid aminotransferase
MAGWSASKTWTFFEGDWHEGNVPLMGPRSHAAWLASTVFDGARAFEGVTPDIDLHVNRVNRSAATLNLKPQVSVETWLGLVKDGLKRFGPNAALYIRPMYWAERTGFKTVAPDPESTTWCLCLYDAPMPDETPGSVTLSPFRRPTLETMPVDAKAACLYPNNARSALYAQSRGFDDTIVCDVLGNVSELASSNVFLVKDGCVFTPVPNGTFLNGITRQRVIGLLRKDGVEVREVTLTYQDFLKADEIFSTGNFGKVTPVARIDDRTLGVGPLYRRARKLYWEFAHG